MKKPRLRKENANMDLMEKVGELIEQTIDMLIESDNGEHQGYVKDAAYNILQIRSLLDKQEEERKKKPKINDFSDEVHKIAEEHGWWDPEPSFPEIIALCHSELSEALEEYRTGGEGHVYYYKNDVPHGIGIELADVILRILDYCSYAGIDIEACIEDKTRFNRNRPYRHGGKVI